MLSLLETKGGRFVNGDATELDRLFERLNAKQQPRLLLHVHGGLVSGPSARKSAENLNTAYRPLRDAGWETSYLIWHSGFLDVLAENWPKIGGNLVFSIARAIIGRWLMPRAGDLLPNLKDALGSPLTTSNKVQAIYGEAVFAEPEVIQARLSVDEWAVLNEKIEPGPGDELYDALANNPELSHLSQAVEAALGRRLKEGALLRPEDEAILPIFEQFDPSVQKLLLERAGQDSLLLGQPFFSPLFWLAAKAGYRALQRAINKRDHGFQATVVEEVMRAIFLAGAGADIWDRMKDYVDGHFGQDGACTEFLARLNQLAESTQDPVQLLFVGHSAGSILACELLAQTASLQDNIQLDFVFLAPAVRMEKAAAALGSASSRLNNIRIFTMSDQREKSDALDNKVPLDLYPHSLLYLISGILERKDDGDSYADAPLLGMQRHLKGLSDNVLTTTERNARSRAATFLAAGPTRVCYAGEGGGGPGQSTDARTHGTIDDDEQTLASICHIGLHGF